MMLRLAVSMLCLSFFLCVVAEGAACDKCANHTATSSSAVDTYTHQPKGQIIRLFHQKISQIKTIDCLFVVINCFDIIQYCLFVSLLFVYYIILVIIRAVLQLCCYCAALLYIIISRDILRLKLYYSNHENAHCNFIIIFIC